MGARRRVTVYAAFTEDGQAVRDLWHLDRKVLDRIVGDRAVSGFALVPEHVVQITVWLYSRHRVASGLPELDFSGTSAGRTES